MALTLDEIREKLSCEKVRNHEHDELIRRLSMSDEEINADIERSQFIKERTELGTAVSKEFNIPLVHYEYETPTCHSSRLMFVLGVCIFNQVDDYFLLHEVAKSIEGLYDYKGLLYIKMPWFTDMSQEFGRASIFDTLKLACNAWAIVGEDSDNVKVVRAGREFGMNGCDGRITMYNSNHDDFFFRCRHNNHPVLGVD
jgi:hypothetical protein